MKMESRSIDLISQQNKLHVQHTLLFVNDIQNKSYMNCGNEMKMKK